MQPVLNILKKYLPHKLFKNLVNFLPQNRYATATTSNREGTLRWTRYQRILDKIDLEQCANELRHELSFLTHSDDHVKVFHIDQNHKDNNVTEPNPKNTKKMVHQFLFYIYQRNVLASLIKYILLKVILNKWKQVIQHTTKKSTFYCIYQRLSEIIFESVLISFNGGNYDNYLICNDLIILLSEMNQKIKIFKKGATISSIIINSKKYSTKHNDTTQKINKIEKQLGHEPFC